MRVDDTSRELTRAEAIALQSAIGEALTTSREYVYTTGTHREDGSYVVSRRGAESAGNRKVFDSFGNLESLYREVPARIDAEAIGQHGITGSRRHLVVRHFAEHPAFNCRVVSRRPLVARKNER
ncbi:hypothetical protein ACLI4Q_16090 [Natrialbaceae archaeon A-CW1-1]